MWGKRALRIGLVVAAALAVSPAPLISADRLPVRLDKGICYDPEIHDKIGSSPKSDQQPRSSWEAC
jgi:hypothetical protein